MTGQALAHLGRLVRNQHALPSSDGVLQVLGVVVALHADQVARWRYLTWKRETSFVTKFQTSEKRTSVDCRLGY